MTDSTLHEGHTPLPWLPDRRQQLRGSNGESVNVWSLGIGFAPRDTTTEANAALIVHRVNKGPAADAMERALAVALDSLEYIHSTEPAATGYRQRERAIKEGKQALAAYRESAS